MHFCGKNLIFQEVAKKVIKMAGFGPIYHSEQLNRGLELGTGAYYTH